MCDVEVEVRKVLIGDDFECSQVWVLLVLPKLECQAGFGHHSLLHDRGRGTDAIAASKSREFVERCAQVIFYATVGDSNDLQNVRQKNFQ